MRKVTQKFAVAVLALAIAVPVFLFSGCHHSVNTSNPAVIAAVTLTDASNTCKTLEDTLTAADHAIELVETTDPEYYQHAKPLIRKLSAANRTAGDKINLAMHGQPADWQNALTAIAVSVDPKDLTNVQVKNQTSQLLIVASMQALAKIVSSIH